ncbi:hypothetical protein JOM56_012369 [Amanita muscaria]
MGIRTLMNFILPLFRRQDHSFSSSTIYTNTSMSHSRASRDNQVLFLELRFRQRGHGGILVERGGEATAVASPTLRKKTGGFEPFLPNPVRTNLPLHTMANGSSSILPPRPIQDVDPSNPIFTPPAAPPQPPQEASSLAPPINTDFSKCGGGGGERAQHLELPQEVVEWTVDQGLLAELRCRLVQDTSADDSRAVRAASSYASRLRVAAPERVEQRGTRG